MATLSTTRVFQPLTDSVRFNIVFLSCFQISPFEFAVWRPVDAFVVDHIEGIRIGIDELDGAIL